MKICLAIANAEIEEWFVKKLGNNFTFTKNALHTGMVLPIIKEERPDILILKEDLPQNTSFNQGSEGGLSFGLLVKKIRSSFLGCRIIIIANNHKDGDQFLRTMVSMGVYDIGYGETVHLMDIVSMVYEPKDYKYGARLQGLSEEELRTLKTEDGVPLYGERKLPNNTKGIIEKQDAYNPASAVSPAPVSIPVQTPKTDPRPVRPSAQPAGGSGDTTVLTSGEEEEMENPQNPFTALVFEPFVVGQTWNTNNILRSDVPMLPKKKGKLFLFTSARCGVGNTATALNTAYQLAKAGANVLLLDLNTDFPSVFPKIGIKNMGYGFDTLAKDVENKPIADIKKLCHSRELIDKTSPRYEGIPASLYFMNLVDCSDLDLFYTEEALDHLLYDFDYVVVDASGILLNDYFSAFVTLADKVVLTVTQDLYELSEANKWVERLESISIIKTKLFVSLNFYERNISPNTEDVKNYLKPLNVVAIPGDRKRFYRASAGGLIYSYQGKKKVTVSYQQLAYLLKGGDS